MACENDTKAEKRCPQSGRRIKPVKPRRWPSWLVPMVGPVSLQQAVDNRVSRSLRAQLFANARVSLAHGKRLYVE